MKTLFITISLILCTFSLLMHTTEARGRYGSTRVGGYTSHGKGSHLVGGYIRSCHGQGCH